MIGVLLHHIYHLLLFSSSFLVLFRSPSGGVNAFNLDLNWPVFKTVRKPLDEAYFGFSLAQHIVKSSKTPYILVGAPKDSIEYNDIFHNASGAIYKCPINLNRFTDCEQIPVDFKSRRSDELSDQNVNLDANLKEQFMGRIFDNQWLGVTVASTGEGSFGACAHRYVHYYNFTTRDEHAAYGACYRFGNEFAQEYKHVPCLQYSYAVNTFYFNNYAYCQAGTSLSMMDEVTLLPSNAQDVYIGYGMPSALNFRGLVGVKAIGKSSTTEYVYKNRSSLCKFDIETDKPMLDGTGQCPHLWDKHSYMGMSHAIIRRYMPVPNVKSYVVASGAPRESLTGAVRFFTIMFDVSFGQVTKLMDTVLRGSQSGSYFGASMLALDLNADKHEDLIVGAPYYSRKFEPNVGAIYIYQNHKNKGFTNSYALNFTGTMRSLFGYALSSLGDIDKDGFNDFVVGAPYEQNPSDSTASGAIYIYRGNEKLSEIKLSQRIFASEVRIPPVLAASVGGVRSLQGFGFSLSGGLDLDASGYPDLAVGVLKSNTAIVLRTRPVVYVDAFVDNGDSLTEIDQKRKECRQDDGTEIVCFKFDLCFQLNEKKSQMQAVNRLPALEYKLEAEPNQTYSRVYFSSSLSYLNGSIRLNLNYKKMCTKIDVYIKKDNYDYIRPIKFAVAYRLSTNEDSGLFGGFSYDLAYIKNFPIIHQDSNKTEFEANFKKDCGPDKKCITDLSIHAYFVNLIIGDDNVPLLSFKESDSVTIALVVENGGFKSEPAYATQILIDFDERLDFTKKQDMEPNGFSCVINYKIKSNSLVCKLTSDVDGVPFGANTTAKFSLTFSSTRLYRYANITSEPNLVFKIEAKTLSVDTNLNNNNVELLAKLKVRANLYLYGTKSPEQVFFSDNSIVLGEIVTKTLDQIGPIIEHTYKINNGGPFSVNYFQLIVDWPYEARLPDFAPSRPSGLRYIDGKYLLYLIERPTKIPNNHPIDVVCSSYTVDPLKIAELKHSINKRSIEEEEEENLKISKIKHGSASRVATIDCFSNTAYCYKINCSFFGDFSKDESISLKFTARLWNSTLLEDYSEYEKVLIKSHAKLVLSDEIHDDRPGDNENSVATVAYSRVSVKLKKVIPVWIYVVSVFIGLVILVVCIIVFWKLGFFERKKFPDTIDEKYVMESEKLRNTPY